MNLSNQSTESLQSSYEQLKAMLDRAHEQAPDSQFHEDVFAQCVAVCLELFARAGIKY